MEERKKVLIKTVDANVHLGKLTRMLKGEENLLPENKGGKLILLFYSLALGGKGGGRKK